MSAKEAPNVATDKEQPKKRINARSKGIRGERMAIELLQPVVERCFLQAGKKSPVLQRNTLQADGLHKGNSDISGLDFLALEVKNCADLHLNQWWEQCLRQCREATKQQTPVLLYRTSGKWLARLRVELPCSDSKIFSHTTIDKDTFLQWFEYVLTKHISESCDYKPSGLTVSKGPKALEAEAWCKRMGWPVPELGSEYMAMLQHWEAAKLRGEG
jgi:hypothetical protein